MLPIPLDTLSSMHPQTSSPSYATRNPCDTITIGSLVLLGSLNPPSICGFELFQISTRSWSVYSA